VELHEARTAADGTPGKRRDRQQRLGRALTGNPGIGSYIASKHGVVGLTRTAALEYVKRGIRVNAVNPGLIDTQIACDVVAGDEQAYRELEKGVPMGRAGKPEEIAAAVLWLCSSGASYVVGQAVTVDGGMTVP
jgi:NAD(P)-dependent dehydrogenase (short-subunit alcohol dehydrogenase family)